MAHRYIAQQLIQYSTATTSMAAPRNQMMAVPPNATIRKNPARKVPTMPPAAAQA